MLTLRTLLAGLVLAVCIAINACPAMADENPVYALLSTKPLGAALEDVRSLTGAVMKNTPYKMLAAPGFLDNIVCEGMLHLPLSVLDMERGAHQVLSDRDNNKTGGILVLPVVKNFAAALAQAKSPSLQFEPLPEGCYQITVAARRQRLYLVPATGDWVVIHPVLKTAQTAAGWLKDWQPKPAAHTLTLTFEAGRFYANYQSEFDRLAERMAAAVEVAAEKQETAGKPVTPREVALQKVLMRSGAELSVKFLRATDRIVLNADATAQGLQVRAEIAPVHGLALDKLAGLSAAFDEDAENARLMALLPGDSFHVSTAGMPEVLLKMLERNLTEAAEQAKVGGTTPEAQQCLEHSVRLLQLLRQTRGKGLVSASGVSGTGGMRLVIVGTVKNGEEKAVAGVAPLLREMAALLNVSTAGDFAVVSEDRKVGAVDVLALTLKVRPQPGMPLPMAAGIMLSTVKKDQTYLLGTYHNHYIIAGGAQAAEDFAAVMQRIDGAARELPAAFTQDFAAAKDKNLGYGSFYPHEFLRGLMIVVRPTLAKAPAQLVQIFEEAVNALPASSAPMSLCASARKESFALTLNIPVESVDKAVEEGIKAKVLFEIQKSQWQQETRMRNLERKQNGAVPSGDGM